MAHHRPKMPLSTIEYFARISPDFVAPTINTFPSPFDLDHAIISKAIAQGLPNKEWIKIHDPRNIIKISHSRHLYDRPLLTERIRAIVMRHGYDAVKEWFESIAWKSSPPFQFPLEEDVT